MRALQVQRGLDDVVVGDPRIPLAVEHDLDEGRFVEALAELGELRLHVAPDPVVDVPASHRDLQSHGASSGCSPPTVDDRRHDLTRPAARPDASGPLPGPAARAPARAIRAATIV